MTAQPEVGTKIRLPDSTDTPVNVLLFDGPRGAAVRLLSRAENTDANINNLLDAEFRRNDWSAYDRALIIELVFGTLRWQGRLDWILTGFYHGEFAKCIPTIKFAMRIALYQILMLAKIPPATAIQECASLVRRIKDDKSANAISGVLKNILRNIDNIRYPSKDDNFQLFISVTLSHPLWMVKRWCERHGEETAEKILSANNERAHLHVYANHRRTTPEVLAEKLRGAECTSEAMPHFPNVLRINGLQNIASMEPFMAGDCIVARDIDVYISRLANIGTNASVRISCPDRSTISMSIPFLCTEQASFTTFARFDVQASARADRWKALGVRSCQVLTPSTKESPDALYDVVIIEPKVSGLGLLHARPEMRWRIELDAVRKGSEHQRAALEDAALRVAAGGVLVYACSSFESEETFDIIKGFLESHPEFSRDDASGYCDASVCRDGCLSIQFHVHKVDTVFAARLVRSR
ncbi:MAG: transcription antitermination factor NusB [Candidatus Kapaibacterium sp.]